MDVTPFLELTIAPRVVFNALPERSARPRFLLRNGDGGWDPVTWQSFADEIRQVACFLLAHEIQATDRAAIFASNRVAWLSAALGIQAAGGVMVPIYPNSTADQAAYIVEHSDARFVFVDSAPLLQRIFAAWPQYSDVRRIVLFDDALDPAVVLQRLQASEGVAPALDEVSPRLVRWSEACAAGRAFDAAQPGVFERVMDGISLDQPGVMLYTSGTTGRPKGVPLTHRNVAANGRDWLECNGPLLEEGDVDVLWLPFSHIFGFGEACLGNTLGFTTYLSDPLTVLDRLPEVRPTVFMSVPRYWEKLAQAALAEPDPAKRPARLAAATGGRLRFCLSGGAGLKREVKELFYDCGVLIIEGYGLTETSPTLTLNRPDAFRFDTVGRPLPSVDLRLAPDGEIEARGPNVFAGYHKDEPATAAIFTEDGWIKTGDLGRLTDDGFLQIIGRKKEILVLASGKNVPPANIELCFADDPLIAHLVVYGDNQPYLVAGVWLDPVGVGATVPRNLGQAAREATLRALVQARIDAVNAQLARHETVKRFAIMDRPLTIENGLLTTTLKVRRNAVYQAFAADFEGLYAASSADA